MKCLNPTRRTVLALLVSTSSLGLRAAQRTPIEVWKDPSCGCCGEWVKQLESNGFAVTVRERGNNGIRAQLGIDPKYASCHTAIVAGYGIEGHVPATEIRRLLAERPAARGLAVPGMEVGSPGMDGPMYHGRRDAFDVLLLARDGGASVYRHYDGGKI